MAAAVAVATAAASAAAEPSSCCCCRRCSCYPWCCFLCLVFAFLKLESRLDNLHVFGLLLQRLSQCSQLLREVRLAFLLLVVCITAAALLLPLTSLRLEPEVLLLLAQVTQATTGRSLGIN